MFSNQTAINSPLFNEKLGMFSIKNIKKFMGYRKVKNPFLRDLLALRYFNCQK